MILGHGFYNKQKQLVILTSDRYHVDIVDSAYTLLGMSLSESRELLKNYKESVFYNRCGELGWLRVVFEKLTMSYNDFVKTNTEAIKRDAIQFLKDLREGQISYIDIDTHVTKPRPFKVEPNFLNMWIYIAESFHDLERGQVKEYLDLEGASSHVADYYTMKKRDGEDPWDYKQRLMTDFGMSDEEAEDRVLMSSVNKSGRKLMELTREDIFKYGTREEIKFLTEHEEFVLLETVLDNVQKLLILLQKDFKSTIARLAQEGLNLNIETLPKDRMGLFQILKSQIGDPSKWDKALARIVAPRMEEEPIKGGQTLSLPTAKL